MMSTPTSKACRCPVDNNFPSVPYMPPGSLLTQAITSWQEAPCAVTGWLQNVCVVTGGH